MEDEYASITGRDVVKVGPNSEVPIVWYAPYVKTCVIAIAGHQHSRGRRNRNPEAESSHDWQHRPDRKG